MEKSSDLEVEDLSGGGGGGVLSQSVLSSIWPQFPDLQSGLLKQMITEKASNSKYSNSRHNFKEQFLIADYSELTTTID